MNNICLIILAAVSFGIAMEAEGTERKSPAVSAADSTDGSVHVPAFSIPFSPLASEEARKGPVNFFNISRVTASKSTDDVIQARLSSVKQLEPLREDMLRMFSVTITPQTIGGVPTETILPKEGVSIKNKHRVLINLHGGGFVMGWHAGSELQSIPISALAKIKVITVDYSLWPEHHYPTASKDVAAVYKELLKTYRPENIGIYGCSSGAVLTAQAVAWFQKFGLPRPGAIGLFCSGATADVVGDFTFVGMVLNGYPPNSIHASDMHYFDGADMRDPLVSPMYFPDILRKFPATLLIAGGRDVGMSSTIYTHAQLVKAGVDAELHVWEGMGHAFFYYPNLPESREAWNVITKFFDKQLGTAAGVDGRQ